jgi:hypothetical protein
MRKPSELFRLYSGFALSPEAVIRKATDAVLDPGHSDARYVKERFSELLDTIESKAFEIFLASQSEAWAKAIEIYVPRAASEAPTRSDVARLLSERFDDLDAFFLSLAQSRKARAGQAFQVIITHLVKHMDYPFSEHPSIDGKPDFVFPSEEHFRRNPVDCIIFTVKRTVRERWRQIVTEGTRGLGFYLATIDRKVAGASLREMGRNRIYLVVPKRAKAEVPTYAKSQTVMDFETFFADYLDPAVNRWRKLHVI